MKNKSELIEKMYNIMYNTRDNSIETKVNTFLRDNGQFENDFLKLSNRNIMKQISDKTALVLANALSRFGYIDLADYFTPVEINSLNNYQVDEISNEELMTFHNVFKLDERQYVAVASVEQIAMLQNRGFVVVDPNFQRQTKRDRVNNSILETVYINSSRVTEIANSLQKNDEDGSYKFNALRYNLMLNEGLLPVINSDGTMKLDTKCKLICIDGNHRQKAAVKAYASSNNKEQFKHKYFVVLLTNFAVSEVKDTISQEWNVEKVSRSAIANMKNTPENDMVLKIRLSEKLEPLMSNSFTNDSHIRTKFVSTEFLAAAIKAIYGDVKLLSKQEVVIDRIIKVLNQFVYLNEEVFEKKTFYYPVYKYKFHKLTIVILVWLSCKLDLDKSDWKEQFKSIIENIDFSINLNPNDRTFSAGVVKTIVKYCEENINV